MCFPSGDDGFCIEFFQPVLGIGARTVEGVARCDCLVNRLLQRFWEVAHRLLQVVWEGVKPYKGKRLMIHDALHARLPATVGALSSQQLRSLFATLLALSYCRKTS
jgi:hypothetical protein